MTEHTPTDIDVFEQDLLEDIPTPDDYAATAYDRQQDGFSVSHRPKAVVYLLHGWDAFSNYSPGVDFRPAVDYVRAALRGRGVDVHAPYYNTHESHFHAGGNLVNQHLGEGRARDNIHFFGYSMGGLVARQAVAQGLAPRSLTTVATPNEGTGWWVPNGIPFNAGAASMFPNANDLTVLNSRDEAYRDRYTTYGFWYKGAMNSIHDNDGMIEQRSANMMGQSVRPARSFKVKFGKEGWFAPIAQPHGDIQKLDYIKPALNQFLRDQVFPSL